MMMLHIVANMPFSRQSRGYVLRVLLGYTFLA